MWIKLITIGLTTFLLAGCSGGGPVSLVKDTHVHGLAVDRGDSSRLYIATHDGLFVLEDDEQLSRVGKQRHDFMGFSVHPTDPSTLFSSGHPKGGGNLGFMISKDGGRMWVKANNGSPLGPADFHTMMVHPANGDHIYGWFRLRIHRSLDGGRNWEVLANQPPEVLSFAGDPKNENVVYLGTIGDLLMSTDKGESWARMTDKFASDVVFDIDVDRRTGDLYLATRDQGIVRATREFAGGFSFEDLGKLPGSDIPEHLALDPEDSQVMYTFSKGHVLYKSADGGRNWQKVF